jgi:RNA polymerase sigma factor (sigma-70 family)
MGGAPPEGRRRRGSSRFPAADTILGRLIRLPRCMEATLTNRRMSTEQDERISATIAREAGRLRAFVRRRVADTAEAEDVLQDVFVELVVAYRLMQPIEQVTAWLYRVARNRITDLFRRKRPLALGDVASSVDEDGDRLAFEDMIPSRDAGPEAAYVQAVLLEELDAALDELPEEQRAVFVAHELEGRSFKELAAATGVNVNTLLSRKHYAVRYLRRRLRGIYEELGAQQGE